jgi:type IV fimbrial biogenesis protein FimT
MLIELLCAITIATILLCLSVPTWQTAVNHSSTLAHTEKIATALQLAKSLAIDLNNNIVFCKSRDAQHCGGDWRDGQIIIDNHGKILRTFPGIPAHDSLVWNSSRGLDNAITFLPSGYTNGQQGSFYYCSGKEKVALAIILEQTGRLRIDNHTADGKTIPCQ